MKAIRFSAGTCLALAALPLPLASGALAQDPLPAAEARTSQELTVNGTPPADLTGLEAGPEVQGIVSARKDDRLLVSGSDGTRTPIALSAATQVQSKKGLFGMSRTKLAADNVLNGIPVTIKTVKWGGGLVASQIRFRDADYKIASMIRGGTAQGFAEQTAATEALKGRMADIDKYNVKSTTNVNFDTGKAELSSTAKADLCAAAMTAQANDNALLLVVGYTDSTGGQEINQQLSEKRASRVVNYLQQACGWKPYRMLTPTGMAEADPVADNQTPEGKAQNRRVAVNVLVSKSVDGI